MKSPSYWKALVVIFIGQVCISGVSSAGSSLPKLPGPVAKLCSVSKTQFQSWQVTPNSMSFNVPNNAGFTVPAGKDTDCAFYQQMTQNFLWLTSPQQGYAYTFLGPQFYNVTGFDSNNNPVFSQNSPLRIDSKLQVQRGVFNLRGAKSVGRVGKAMVLDTPTQPLNPTGQASGQGLPGQMVNSGALISQVNSLVYYAIHVNDVYKDLQNNQVNVAYFKKQALTGTQSFPLTLAEVSDIATASNVASYADANALIIEVKTSWVDASIIPTSQSGNYLTIKAEVPKFIPCSPAKSCYLQWDGSTYENKTLAMVGMHVVAPVAGHPELVWATFEQSANAPDNTWYFKKVNGTVSIQNYKSNSVGKTFFKPGTALAGANTELIQSSQLSGGGVQITRIGNAQSVASSVVNLHPWGNIQPTCLLCDTYPANGIATVIANNTKLLSLAESMIGNLAGLPGGVARANYIQSGAVWTANGQIPTKAPKIKTESGQPTLEGSPALSNTTMETFQQAVSVPYLPGCFSCHNTSGNTPLNAGVNVSHVFNLTPIK